MKPMAVETKTVGSNMKKKNLNFKFNNNYYSLGSTNKFVTFKTMDEYIKAESENDDIGYPEVGINEYFCRIYTPDMEVQANELIPGIYEHKCNTGSSPERLIPSSTKDEYIIDLLQESMKWHDNVKDFISKFHLYEEMQIQKRRNFLLWGPPGTGKSTAVRHLANKLMKEEGAIVIYTNSILSSQMSEALNAMPNIKVIIMEEIATSLEEGEIGQGSLLRWLDGEKTLNNSITILTTNYPERLPANLIRCGRVDYFEEIAGLTTLDRKKVLSFYLKTEISDSDLEDTNDMVIADLKEVCLLTKLDNIPLKEAISVVKAKNQLAKKNFKGKNTTGIGFNSPRNRLIDAIDSE